MIRTVKLYETDGHCCNFTAVVLECIPLDSGKFSVILDRSAFFPEGGGQNSDKGTINGIEVTEVKTNDDRSIIYHIIDSEIEKGSIINGQIDIKRRFSDMQNHTAEHIVSGIIHKLYNLDNIGFHMGHDEITMDFNGALTAKQLEYAEKQANIAVYENLPVKISFYEPGDSTNIEYRSKKEINSVLRIVEIEGVDACACCAPHVLYTGEIGLIKITGFQKYKKGIRISMLAGSRAFEEMTARFDTVKYLCSSFSSKPEDIVKRIENLKEETAILKMQKNAAKNAYYELKANELCRRYEISDSSGDTSGSIIVFEKEGTFDDLRAFVNILTKKTDKICGAFARDEENSINSTDTYRFVMASAYADMTKTAAALKSKLQIFCGGRREMIQGTVTASEYEIKSAVTEVCEYI